jgi:hypothetical protein
MATTVNQPAVIGGELNGSYIPLNELPPSLQKLITDSGKVVIIRESTNESTPGGGRTSGTMWYKGNILGFTVEDAIRETKKVQDKTAIPDIIQDASKFDGLPSTFYNIILSTVTSNNFIRSSFYKGNGLRVSSAKDPTGTNIYESDVFVPQSFETSKDNPTGVAFSGVFIHHGSSEKASSGCIIFSKTRKTDNTLIESPANVQNLNKYLVDQGIIGKGKLQQLVIINLWEFPTPPPITTSTGIVVSLDTNQPITDLVIENITPLPILKPTLIPEKK